MKSGSLNLPEPSGPVQACNGVVLAFNCIYRLVKSACTMRLCCCMVHREPPNTADGSHLSHTKSTVKMHTVMLSKVTATNSKPLKISQHPRIILDYSNDSVNRFINCIRYFLVERHLNHTHIYRCNAFLVGTCGIKLACGWESRCTVYLCITVYERNTRPLQTHR